MRKVADIKDPKVGMYVGVQIGPHSPLESEIIYGRVTGSEIVMTGDVGEAEFILDTGERFRPAQGDVLTYYGATQKRSKSKRTAHALEQRELRYAERKAVRDEMTRLRNRNKVLMLSTLLLTAIVIVLGVMAHGLVL